MCIFDLFHFHYFEFQKKVFPQQHYFCFAADLIASFIRK